MGKDFFGTALLFAIAVFFLVSFFHYASATTYYIDFAGGSDNSAGTSTSAAWKHSPGDPNAAANVATANLLPGDTVLFKGGVKYVIQGTGTGCSGGIALNWDGSAASPITYDGGSAGTWGTGKAIITDNYNANGKWAFCSSSARSNLVFKDFNITGLGGSATLPTDTGTAVPPNSGGGIVLNGGATNITIQDSDFSELGYYFNQKPMSSNSIVGAGVQFFGATNVSILNCTFKRTAIPIELQPGENRPLDGVTIANSDISGAFIWGIDVADSVGKSTVQNLSIHDNKIHDFYQLSSYWAGYGEWPHIDGIFLRGAQGTGNYSSQWTNNKIYNNSFYNDAVIGEAYGTNSLGTADIYFTGGPSATVFNNTFANTPISDGAIYLVDGPETSVPQTINLFNNTFYSQYYPTIEGQLSTGANPIGATAARNNIIYDEWPANTSNNYQITFDKNSSIPVPFTLNNNLYRSLNTSGYLMSVPDVGLLTLTQMRSHGWETNGVAADPLFVDISHGDAQSSSNNLRLKTDSPAIGAGANLSAYCASIPELCKDKDGKTRPTSGAWDIGAYQYSSTPQPNYHPADTPTKDWSISLSEYLAYANCWKTTCNWNANGTISLSYYLNAANIWKYGPLAYHSIATGCPPNQPSTCWAPGAS